MNSDDALRQHVLYALRGRGAHVDFDGAIDGIPIELRGAKPKGVSHSPWRLLEHMRICQWDILEYSRDPQHISPDRPDGYWPIGDALPSDEAWNHSVATFRDDLMAMQDFVADPAVDLLTPIPHGQKGHTVLREALLLADHNAYHIGQIVAIRRALGNWKDDG